MKHLAGARQTTLASEIALNGIGVHTGAPVSIHLSPADINTGICFVLPDGDDGEIELPASSDAISNVTLCTVLSDGNGASVATVEHLLAAVRALGVDNIRIEIDSGEVPIMDGSSVQFVDALDEAGIREQGAPRRFIKVLKPVRIEDGRAWAELSPHDGFRIDIGIEFDTPLIGNQRIRLEITPDTFRDELARARTFGFMKDVERLWATGLALGASLENTVAIGEDRVINPEGLRFADEFVRHKALDAVGDLALAGAPILGAYRSQRGGHRLNAMVLKALLADRHAWTFVEAPWRREALHAEAGFGAVAANFAADRS
ncbi:UDP-3-O-[3-hydroxymyristoyl] N-acetylglucosamine deacetylase [bacterium BMS3Bbin10]|nr:UDP-3-O-[3-hydroxymyristoyl] N-acetylglucosamine deacetylase [bacterium BMS3Bbin10]